MAFFPHGLALNSYQQPTGVYMYLKQIKLTSPRRNSMSLMAAQVKTEHYTVAYLDHVTIIEVP